MNVACNEELKVLLTRQNWTRPPESRRTSSTTTLVGLTKRQPRVVYKGRKKDSAQDSGGDSNDEGDRVELGACRPWSILQAWGRDAGRGLAANWNPPDDPGPSC